MIRSTRHESVFVKARRSRGTWERNRSSSVIAVRGELLERCDMVVLHVIEEGGEAHVPRARVGDDAGGGQVAHARRRIGRRQHDDGRAIRGARRRACSSRAYRNTIPGPPSSHLSPPAVRKSTPVAFASTGSCPTDW